MTCPACLRAVSPGSEFCSHCGVKLHGPCWRCGATNRVGDHACVQCGEAVAPQGMREARPAPRHHVKQILESRRALEGERKVVTVLFADLQGSLELIAGRDPEDVRRVLDGVLGQMLDAVHAYDGTVNQLLGDGIMALFWRSARARGPRGARVSCRARDSRGHAAPRGGDGGARADPPAHRPQLRRGDRAIHPERPADGLHRHRRDATSRGPDGTDRFS